MDSQAFHLLAPEELSGSVAVRLLQYTGLSNKAIDRLIATGVATSGTTRFGSGGGRAGVEWWGRFFGPVDISCLLRVSVAPWARDRATPRWLQVGYSSSPPPVAVHAALAPLQAERNRVFRHRTYVGGPRRDHPHRGPRVRPLSAAMPSLVLRRCMVAVPPHADPPRHWPVVPLPGDSGPVTRARS